MTKLYNKSGAKFKRRPSGLEYVDNAFVLQKDIMMLTSGGIIMRYHKSKIFFSIILVLALFIGIGYAYLSTKLQIGGATKVLKPSFANDSWSTIISNVKSGNTSYYQVGDTKEVDMGSFGTHTLRIANTSTPAECSTAGFSQTACGFVLEFADIITEHNMNSSSTDYPYGDNIGGWPASELYTYVQNDIYNALPSELKNGIIDTYVVSGHGSSDSANFISTDKLYLLSTKEVWGKEGTSNVINYDTTDAYTRQLDYYKEKGETTLNYSGAIKQYNGSNSYWWLRAAPSNISSDFYYVYTNGYWSNFHANYTYGVAPAFRIG